NEIGLRNQIVVAVERDHVGGLGAGRAARPAALERCEHPRPALAQAAPDPGPHLARCNDNHRVGHVPSPCWRQPNGFRSAWGAAKTARPTIDLGYRNNPRSAFHLRRGSGFHAVTLVSWA